MTAAQPVLSLLPPAGGIQAAAPLPQWIIWRHAGKDGTPEITAIPADEAFLFNAGSKCLGRVNASDKAAALDQWERLESEGTWCVVETHMLNGDASDQACFAVFELTPPFLRNVQALAAQLSQTVSLSNPISAGKPRTLRTLTMAFDEPAAHVRWDNPDVGDGHWEIIVHGDEQVLVYAAIDTDCTTTGMHLAELEKIFARHQIGAPSVTAYARPDSYGELIEAIEASKGDAHMAEILTVLDSALVSAFYQHAAVETQKATERPAQRESAEMPS